MICDADRRLMRLLKRKRACPMRRSRELTGATEKSTVRACRKDLRRAYRAFKTVGHLCGRVRLAAPPRTHYKTYDADETEVASLRQAQGA